MKTSDDEFEKIQNPHDAAVKAAFKKKKVATAFFRQYLPEEIAKKIDFRTLKVVNASYVDEKLKSRHSDILYRVRYRGKPALLYILFEHQSTSDYWIAFRLLCYMVNIWREFQEQNPEAEKLPVILPAVFYHGKQKWTPPRSFAELLETGDGLEKFIPDFRYRLYDLSEYEDQRLFLGKEMAMNLIIYLFKHIYDDDFSTRFVQAMEYLARFQDETTQLEFLEWALRYTFSARDDEQAVIDRGIDVLGKKTARRMAMTIAERLRQEGKVAGAQSVLYRLLKKRFGKMTPLLEQNLRQSDSDLLDQFSESIFDFEDLKDAENWWERYGNKGNA